MDPEAERPDAARVEASPLELRKSSLPPAPRGDRRAAFARLVSALGPTPIGREIGLARLESFEDMCATLPLHDDASHLQRVETRLGFGDSGDLEGAQAERDLVVERWRKRSHIDAPTRFCMLGRRASPVEARGRHDDARAWSEGKAEWSVLDKAVPELLLEQLGEREPEVLVVSSLHTVAWLERHTRSAIERALPSLRCVLGEYDLSLRLRSRLPVLNAGRWHRGGRLALPADPDRSRADDRHARAELRLAWDSALLELRDAGTAARAVPACVHLDRSVAGARYELVLSGAAGFLRLRTGTYLRLLGYEPVDDAGGLRVTPRVQPIQGPPPDLPLEGVTLRGDWLTAALRQAFEPEDPALVAAVLRGVERSAAESARGQRPDSLFGDTELGTVDSAGHGRARARARAIVARVEVRGSAREGFELRLAERFDARLQRLSPAYAFLRERGELEIARVERNESGADRASMWSRASALQGAVARPLIRVQTQI